jgi:DNA-binding transcriptional MocR family regulator
VESPGYHGARDAFVAAGARVEAVPLLSDGLDLRALERLASSRPLRLVHVNPIFQNPTSVVYALEKRAELASLAERYGFYVVEDDLFSDLAWDGSYIPPVRSFDNSGRVIFVKSYSKSLMPGLRIACLEAPPQLRERFESVKRSIDISSNGLMQRVLERFLTSGRFDGHVAAARLRYREAYEAFAAALAPYRAAGLSWERPQGGINLWLELPAGVSARSLAAECLAGGCALFPESSFRYESSTGLAGDSHVRASFGSVAAGSLVRSASILGSALGKLVSGSSDVINT